MKKLSKKSIVSLVLYFIGLAGLIVATIFSDSIFGEKSIFQDYVSDNSFVQFLYSRVPSIVGTFAVIIIEMTLYYILKVIASFTTRKLGNRSITIAKLIFSFLRWILAIVGILVILSVWGVDTAALLASAGILTLVIGLGANSLVADIIAGVFMVFEGDFKVGDIVIINDWRGTVKEIGIRTTKLIDAGGNINIINNAEIKTVVNQTDELSVAKCVISIAYSASLKDVEMIIENNLPKIKEELTLIVDGPYYKGVTALSPSSVDLLFLGYCKEEDIFQAQRDMNRAFKILFDENNINIPFPQVTVSYLKDE